MCYINWSFEKIWENWCPAAAWLCCDHMRGLVSCSRMVVLWPYERIGVLQPHDCPVTKFQSASDQWASFEKLVLTEFHRVMVLFFMRFVGIPLAVIPTKRLYNKYNWLLGYYMQMLKHKMEDNIRVPWILFLHFVRSKK